MSYADTAEAITSALASGATLRIKTDYAGTADLAGEELRQEWEDLAPGEAFTVLGVVDMASSASSQHYIDTGRRLLIGEALTRTQQEETTMTTPPTYPDTTGPAFRAARAAFLEAERRFQSAAHAELVRLLPDGVHAFLFDINDTPRLTLTAFRTEDGEECEPEELEDYAPGVADAVDMIAAELGMQDWEDADDLFGRDPRDMERWAVLREGSECRECGTWVNPDDIGTHEFPDGAVMCASCVHDARRSGWDG